MAFLKQLPIIAPSQEFLIKARVRLIEHISTLKPVNGWLLYLRRVAVSSLIMVLAVGSTMFFVDGRQEATAAQNDYIEVITGSASLKRAERLTWDPILQTTEISPGDLIRVDENGKAVLRFFDETELRLGPGSTLLVSQIYPSPAFARQGIIEVSLYNGRAWVQALNVEDGFSGFTLFTRDAILQVLNGSFDAVSDSIKPTEVVVFRNNVRVQAISPDTRNITEAFELSSGQKLVLGKKPAAIVSSERLDEWAQKNLNDDHNHLKILRDEEFARLQDSAGILPGQMLYPLKLAKERLQLALAGADSVTQRKIDIANNRLNEAVVLLSHGETIKARETLMAYQSATKSIMNNAEPQAREEIGKRIIAQNQKALVAALPTDPPVKFVTDALNETKELIANDSVELETVRLRNAVDQLGHIRELVMAGDVLEAKEALTEHSLATSDILGQAAGITDPVKQKELFAAALTLRSEEAGMLKEISDFVSRQQSPDPSLLAMLGEANQSASVVFEDTVAFIAPLAPELVNIPVFSSPSAEDAKITAFVDRLLKYKTLQGQKNQLARLFREQPELKWDAEFLRAARERIAEVRTQDMIDTYILEAERQQRVQKHKATKQKIDRSKKARAD